jgi:L-asparaginase/Glu-tRNA(Gln) amidotransferase subunit D
MNPTDAWNMTLTEYLNIVKCDDEQQPSIDEEKMTPEYMANLEQRIEENQAKRKSKKELIDIREFING